MLHEASGECMSDGMSAKPRSLDSRPTIIAAQRGPEMVVCTERPRIPPHSEKNLPGAGNITTVANIGKQGFGDFLQQRKR